MATAAGAEALLDGAQTVNDALRELFFEEGTEVEFLKTSETLDEFEVVDALASKWWAEESNFGRNITVTVAEGAAFLADTMAAATHIRIGETIYEIDRRNTITPQGTEVEWRILGDRFTKRARFGTIY